MSKIHKANIYVTYLLNMQHIMLLICYYRLGYVTCIYLFIRLLLYLSQYDSELAESIILNTRRYVQIFSEAITELLPQYKQRDVCLCVYYIVQLG